jgi:hypothetical protein
MSSRESTAHDLALADRCVLVDVILARDVACGWSRPDLATFAARLIEKRTAFDDGVLDVDPCPPRAFSPEEIAGVRKGTPGLHITRVRALRILACAEWAYCTITERRRAASDHAERQRTRVSWRYWVGTLFGLE